MSKILEKIKIMIRINPAHPEGPKDILSFDTGSRSLEALTFIFKKN